MSNFTPFPQPIDNGDGNLDRSQDEATFQREQRQAADAADAAERCRDHYTPEEVEELIDYYQ